MARGYTSKEALGFCTKYFQLYAHNSHRVWESTEDNTICACVLQSKRRRRALAEEEAIDIHKFVLGHTIEMVPYRRYV